MASFEIAYPIVKKNEGGYANRPGDRGGETYKGVARNFHKDWAGWAIIDSYKRVHGPIKNNFVIPNPKLDAMVKELFKKEYWDRMRGDTISSQSVANIFFDTFINSGKAGAIMQTTLNHMGKIIPIDNAIGPKTITAINSCKADTLHDKFKRERIAYLKSQAGKTFDMADLKGLLSRVENSFPDMNAGTIIGGTATVIGLIILFFALKN